MHKQTLLTIKLAIILPSLSAVVLIGILAISQALSAVARTPPDNGCKSSVISEQIQPLIDNGGFAVDLPSGRFACNEDKPYIPASTLKILTSLAALKTLGPDFRIRTEFYLDNTDLYIKGFGDPFLTSERVNEISKLLAGLLHKRNITTIRALNLDASSFVNDRKEPLKGSENPYDAPAGALVVNFNTLPIEVSSTGKISSAENQTPLLPLFREVGEHLLPGTHRVNLYHYTFSSGVDPALRYTAELFSTMLKQYGIQINSWKPGAVPKGIAPFTTMQSHFTVAEMVRQCLQYSSNFIANQLFLLCGAQVAGLPATWEKARQAMTVFIKREFPEKAASITVSDGSGLSRTNRITPAALLEILHKFEPHSDLLPRKDNILLKSGTLDGVYSYCGYFIEAETPAKIPFVLLLNQSRNSRDKLLERLHHASKKVVISEQ